jgi:dinuclear metal center YbgI/SA1388 family protein
MTTVADVAAWLDKFAPGRLAESWDNVGLLWGDPAVKVSRVMTCLTVTSDTAAEAVAERAEVIVSHHPVLFRPTQKIRADQSEGAALWGLARAGVAILSPHTAFDSAEDGINALLARKLGLVEIGPLRPAAVAASFKVVVFTPRVDREKVLEAAFKAGAGRIGAYEECSFSSPGVGTFFGTEDAHPAIGQSGRRESVREWRIELVCPADRLAQVLAATRAAHSYEEPAIDVYPLHMIDGKQGSGRLGRLEASEPLEGLALRVSRLLMAPLVQFAGDPARRIERVAIACGAGDDFLTEAHRAGADALLTGEARFHRALEAEAIGLIIAGHHATERPGVELLAERLADAFPKLRVWPSRREHDPWRGIETRAVDLDAPKPKRRKS